MGLITFMLQQAHGGIYLSKCNPHIKGPLSLLQAPRKTLQRLGEPLQQQVPADPQQELLPALQGCLRLNN